MEDEVLDPEFDELWETDDVEIYCGSHCGQHPEHTDQR